MSALCDLVKKECEAAPRNERKFEEEEERNIKGWISLKNKPTSQIRYRLLGH